MSHVLIVDDHPPTRQFLATVLNHAGHTVLEASDAARALECVRAQQTDLVIKSVHVPNLDGAELVRALRADPVSRMLPVIFYTATTQEPEARDIADSCGVKLVMTSSPDPETILRAVNEALDEHASIRFPGHGTDRMTMRHVANSRLTAVLELSIQTALERDEEQLLRQSCRGIYRIASVDCVIVGVFDVDRDVSHIVSRVSDAPHCAHLQSQLKSFLNGLDEDRRQGKLTRAGFQKRASDVPFLTGASACLNRPIASDRRTYGSLYVCRNPDGAAFSPEDERLITALAAQLTVMYENLLSRREIERLSKLLQKSQAKYRASLKNPTCGICRTDRAGKILAANAVLIEICGFETQKQLLECRDLPFEYIVQTCGSNDIIQVDVAWERPDGDSVLLRINGCCRPDADGDSGFDLIVEDITQPGRLEEQAHESKNTQGSGRLARAIVHDFNDLLTVILGHANVMLEEQPGDERFRQTFSEVRKAGERAAELTRQLRASGKHVVIHPVIVDLNDVIFGLQTRICRLLGGDIEFKVIAGRSLKQVNADIAQIEQVLLNLSTNAREAMPGGGKLVIETANECDWVKLEMRDSGCGMPPEVLTRVFEPFFTTKRSGTGFGLSTVRGIVYQNGGEIEIDSKAEGGTTVRIYLPEAKVDR